MRLGLTKKTHSVQNGFGNAVVLTREQPKAKLGRSQKVSNSFDQIPKIGSESVGNRKFD